MNSGLSRYAFLCALLCAGLAFADASIRKTRDKDFRLRATRSTLANGLVVIMSPDPTVAGVVVDMSFRAGALYEPAHLSGLAHLTEHLMAMGRSPDIDYLAILGRRGGRDFNAFTSVDTMTFRVVVPTEELPLALWANADRLGVMPGRIDQAELDRNRRIVLEERTLRVTDEPFGTADMAFHRAIFPATHPLHGSVIGSTKSLKAITVADVQAFVAKHLVPANGVLTLVGNFEPRVANEWIERTVAKLPPGTRVQPPPFPAVLNDEHTLEVREVLSRRPRVSMGWTLKDLPEPSAEALALGAVLLSVYTDGAFGTDVQASLMRFSGGAVFRVDVTLPHDKTMGEAQDDADALLRFLVRAAVPVEVINATWLSLDRRILEMLEVPGETAHYLTWLELSGNDPTKASEMTQGHWALSREDIQSIARSYLTRSRVIIHVRPVRPKIVGAR